MEPKTKCKLCKCVILQRTADRNKGYCEPHCLYSKSYLERLDLMNSKVTYYHMLTIYDIDFDEFSNEKNEDLVKLLTRMEDGDELCKFNAVAISDKVKNYVAIGYAIIRGEEWFDGVEMHRSTNWEYYKQFENDLNFDSPFDECTEFNEDFDFDDEDDDDYDYDF